MRYTFAVKTLDAVETRVLGSLVEKELTTPEYYPLSLNALVNACNQKSNRDPVMSLDEGGARSGDVELPPAESPAGAAVTSGPTSGERIARIEDQVESLQSEIADLKQQF